MIIDAAEGTKNGNDPLTSLILVSYLEFKMKSESEEAVLGGVFVNSMTSNVDVDALISHFLVESCTLFGMKDIISKRLIPGFSLYKYMELRKLSIGNYESPIFRLLCDLSLDEDFYMDLYNKVKSLMREATEVFSKVQDDPLMGAYNLLINLPTVSEITEYKYKPLLDFLGFMAYEISPIKNDPKQVAGVCLNKYKQLQNEVMSLMSC